MAVPDDLAPGTTMTIERTFTRDDVARFADLSGDRGGHHLVETADGSVFVHGLLTATIPTQLGGELDYLAREFRLEFPNPLLTGQPVTCVVTVESVEELDDRWSLGFSWACTSDDGTVVLRGSSDGVVLKER